MSKFYNLNKFCRFNQFFSVVLWQLNHKVRNVGFNYNLSQNQSRFWLKRRFKHFCP
ncbi:MULTISPECIES: hypothetical protein [Microcystis]|uniref:Uncharacterized protein n=1 Tax=Microcystis aeruginosa (strain NIES-843 / IAM M-2473) TaxID=449447 RepID=B0JI78_MICAN|nr:MULTISPECIES: hypothetical protein [Microcystis]BAG02376.1 unknown protein [Microcystis aeruginosa NIES-843]